MGSIESTNDAYELLCESNSRFLRAHNSIKTQLKALTKAFIT